MTPMMGKISSRSRTCSTGVDSSQNRLLLLANDALALLYEADGHGVGYAIGGRLIRIQDAIEHREITLILCEQGTRQYVAQQQHDSHDLVGLHAPRDDSLGKIARIGLQGLESPGREAFPRVVVHGCRFVKISSLVIAVSSCASVMRLAHSSRN